VRRSRRGRLLATLMVLLVLAVVIAGIVVASVPESSTVRLRQVVFENVHETSSALSQLVSENTK
jgi:predicted PurR-regulated permease PerM